MRSQQQINQALKFGRVQDYEIIQKIGRGRYSDIFEAIHVPTKQKRVIKILKPIRKQKIEREVEMLKTLQENKNVIKYYDILRDTSTRSISLVFEHMDHVNHRQASKILTDLQVREYMYKLLQAVESVHQKGIIHKDIKPHNILFNPKTHQLKLIDFGLSGYMNQKEQMNVNVCSLYYKPPEILLSYGKYNYSLDIWGVGIVFAQLIFDRQPFFHGKNKYDQLEKITRVLGFEDLQNYIEKTEGIIVEHEFEKVLVRKHQKCDWMIFKSQDNNKLVNQEAINLLNQMLKYDHNGRISAKDALNHKYFKPYLNSLENNKNEK